MAGAPIGSAGYPFDHYTDWPSVRRLDTARLGDTLVVGDEKPITTSLMGFMLAVAGRSTGEPCGVTAL